MDEKLKVLNHELEANIEKIKNTEKEAFEFLEKNSPLLSNKDDGIFEQEKREMKYKISKNKVDKLESLINKPYVGELEVLYHNGQESSYYIGYKYFEKNNLIIHDWRSEIGRVFLENINYHEKFNIINNRKISIDNQKVINYYELFTNNEMSNDNHNNYEKILQMNKRNKEILTSLDSKQKAVLSYDGNLIIQGVPGSGKSVIGNYKLSLDSYELDETEKVIYFTSGNALRNNLKITLSNIDSSKINIYLFNELFKFDKLIFNKDFIRDEYNIKKKSGFFEDDTIAKKYYQNQINKFNRSKKNQFDYFLKLNKSENLFNIMNNLKLMDHDLKNNTYYFDDYISYFKIKLNKYEKNLNKIEFDLLIYLYSLYSYYADNFYQQNIRTIYIDEAQDYSILDISFLSRLYHKSKLIFSGDINQSNGITYSHSNWDLIKENFSCQIFIFNKCYRSSNLIIENFNNRMTNHEYGKAIKVSRERGNIINFKTFKEFNIFYENENLNDFALVYLKESTKLFLKKTFKNINNIISAFEIKGLEFKSIILFDIDEINKNKFKKKFFYMLISRSYENIYTVLSL